MSDVAADPDFYQKAYREHPSSMNGRYICSDLFKETIPFYNVDKESKGLFNEVVHNSAAVLADRQFFQALEEIKQEGGNTGKNVVFLTGSPGAGKTASVMSGNFLDKDTALIYEGQLIRPDTVIPKMQAALDAGLNVKIVAVQNTLETTLQNTIHRYHTEGRGASIEVMAQIMGKTADGLEVVHQQFGDRVSLEVHERDNNIRLPVKNGWEHLPILRKEGTYEYIREHLGQILEQSRQTGNLSEDAYTQATGGSGRVEQENRLSLTRALLAYELRPGISGGSGKQNLLDALERLTPNREVSAVEKATTADKSEKTPTLSKQQMFEMAAKEIMAEVAKVVPLDETAQQHIQKSIEERLTMAATQGKTVDLQKITDVKESIQKSLPIVRDEFNRAAQNEQNATQPQKTKESEQTNQQQKVKQRDR